MDLIDASSGGIDVVPIPRDQDYQTRKAAVVRAESGVLTAAVGRISTPELANELVASEKADAVFLGRPLLRNPSWANNAALELGVSPRSSSSTRTRSEPAPPNTPPTEKELTMSQIDTYSHDISGEKEFGFAQSIKVGDTIYVSGQLSHDEAGDFLHADDLDGQLAQVWANLDKVLTHHGVTRKQIVVDTVYVVDPHENGAKIAASHLEYFGQHRPTSSTVGVADLFFPGQLVEIAVIIDTRLPA